ncbi:type IV pilus assembly protein PilM [Candidatus Uhrbacteria bacterium]|nr:type IV pilus assembly protein PilM [Candidatus Uhrbacteria bacterium]
MPLFQKQENRIIGVDIGTSSIKLIELQKNTEGTFSLITYGMVERFNHDVKLGEKEDPMLIARTIKLITEKGGFTVKQATAALPTFLVFTSLISLPQMSKDELDSAIRWEAKKIIPLPLEDIVLDYKMVNQIAEKGGLSFGKKKPEHDKEDLKILLTGAGKETVQKYSDIFLHSGLTLTSLETEMFALSRALVGNDPGEIMIVEIGASITDIIVVESGVPFLGRSIETGGHALTRAIMSSLNINEKRAEQLKRDVGITTGENSGAGEVPNLLKETVEPIVHEIRYTIDLYKSHSVTPSPKATGNIEKIILTGGTALMPGLREHIATALDMRVILGDPWVHVKYQDDLKTILAQIGPKFSVVIGLAMRET